MLLDYKFTRLPVFISMLGLITLNQPADAQLVEPENVYLTEVVAQLRHGGYNIIYSSALISPGFEVELGLDDISLESLADALRQHGLMLEQIRENTWTIVHAAMVQTGSITGQVTDHEGDPIRGARIATTTGLQTTSNEYGIFYLRGITPGLISLVASHPKFLDKHINQIQISNKQPAEVSVLLSRAEELETIIVSASKYEILSNPLHSNTRVGHSEFQNQATIASDPVRLINRLPGSASNGLSARPRVRGGREDEVLVLFDGVRLYEPFHFKDFNSLFSAFDARTIDNLVFYSGGFPVRYGDRLSGVMEIEPRQPSPQLSRELGIGLSGFSFLMSNSNLEKGREWQLLIRHNDLGLVSNLLEEDFGEPVYTDLYAQYGFDLGNDTHMSVNLFLIGDDIEINNSDKTEQVESIYNSGYFWTKLENNWVQNLYSTTLFSVTRIKNDRTGYLNRPGVVSGFLRDDRRFAVYNLKQNWQYMLSNSLLVRYGWGYRHMQGDYDYISHQEVAPLWQDLNSKPPVTDQLNHIDLSAYQYDIFVSARFKLSTRITMELGIRRDAQGGLDKDDRKQLSPRVHLLYRISENSEFRYSWGHYYQSRGIYELDIEDGQDLFDEAQQSKHWVASFKHYFPNGMEMRIEAYYKSASRISTYFDNLTNPVSLLPELQPDRIEISPDHSHGQGIELTLSGDPNSVINWWFNYSLAVIEDCFIHEHVRRNWEQPDAANLGVSWIYRNWNLSVSASFHTGWPTTDLSIQHTLDDEGNPVERVIADDRNTSAFGDYLRVDFKAVKEFTLPGSKLRLELGLTNAFNRANQAGVEYSTTRNAFGDTILKANKKTSLLIAPSLDIFWSF